MSPCAYPVTLPCQQQQQQQQHQCSMPAASLGCSDAELEGVLFVVGDALMDIYAEVSLDFLTAHHLQHGRAIVASPLHQGLLARSLTRARRCIST